VKGIGQTATYTEARLKSPACRIKKTCHFRAEKYFDLFTCIPVCFVIVVTYLAFGYKSPLKAKKSNLKYDSFCVDLNLVVSVLTYLLTKEELTPEEVNGHAIDVVAGGVDTVSVKKNFVFILCSSCRWQLKE